jgi:hypothetical protein
MQIAIRDKRVAGSREPRSGILLVDREDRSLSP